MMLQLVLALIAFVAVTLAVGPCLVQWEDAGCPTLEEL